MQSLRAKVLCFVLLLAFVISFIANAKCDINTVKRKTKNTIRGNITAFEDRLVDELILYSQTGVVSKQLKNDLKIVKRFKEFPKEPYSMTMKVEKRTRSNEFDFCTLCNIVGKILVTYRKVVGSESKKTVTSALMMLCSTIRSKKYCAGVVALNLNIILFIIDNKPDINAGKICSIVGQVANCNKDQQDDADNTVWHVCLPDPISKNPKNKQAKKSGAGHKPLRILHISDIHFDNKYQPGGNTKCDEPLCCGVDQGKPKSPDLAAGVWGDYRNCDMPLHAIENMMDAASKHNVDFIYHTGDIIHHRIWETSIQSNAQSIIHITELFRTKFPNKTIFHIAGNHESNPIDEFAPEHITQDDLSTHWLYNLFAKEWSTWLPKETQKSIRKGGYYTVLVRPGFRIIALNSNVCFVYNWWLSYYNKDPYGQLQWLSDTLYQAELHGEVVHILSHIPSGDKECYKKWSHEYNRIIRRFAHIIKAQFVGHTHMNELQFHYDDDEPNVESPISVAFNGGCITTFIDVNPNYRIYDVNPETYEVEDYEDWIYNLTEANKHGRSVPPKWYKLYSFKEAYGLSTMDLPELGQLVRSLARNSIHSNKYFRMRVSDGDASLKRGCNKKCKEEQLCNLVTSEFGIVDKCETILNEYRG